MDEFRELLEGADRALESVRETEDRLLALHYRVRINAKLAADEITLRLRRQEPGSLTLAGDVDAEAVRDIITYAKMLARLSTAPKVRRDAADWVWLACGCPRVQVGDTVTFAELPMLLPTSGVDDRVQLDVRCEEVFARLEKGLIGALRTENRGGVTTVTGSVKRGFEVTNDADPGAAAAVEEIMAVWSDYLWLSRTGRYIASYAPSKYYEEQRVVIAPRGMIWGS